MPKQDKTEERNAHIINALGTAAASEYIRLRGFKNQREFAAWVGVPRSAVSKLETGKPILADHHRTLLTEYFTPLTLHSTGDADDLEISPEDEQGMEVRPTVPLETDEDHTIRCPHRMGAGILEFLMGRGERVRSYLNDPEQTRFASITILPKVTKT